MLYALLKDTADMLSRADILNMSDQTLMELFVDGIYQRYAFQDTEGEYEDISTWKFLQFNSQGQVVGIDFDFFDGSLALQFLPRTVTYFRVRRAKVDIHIDAAGLPRDMETFIVYGTNKASGTIDFCSFPPALRTLNLSLNRLSGSAEFRSLPARLESLEIYSNKFSGEISLESLPKSLENLNIRSNEFQGPVCLKSLPQALRDLNVSHCAFSGSLDLSNIPPLLVCLLANDNAFTGDLIFDSERKCIEHADFSKNLLSGTAVLHSSLWKVIEIYGNRFTSIVDETGAAYVFTTDKHGLVDGFSLVHAMQDMFADESEDWE